MISVLYLIEPDAKEIASAIKQSTMDISELRPLVETLILQLKIPSNPLVIKQSLISRKQ
jgi:hypothetical protein